MGGKIVVVPGLAVRRYAAAPVERLRRARYEADLRPGLAWRGVPVDVAAYGRQLADEIAAAGDPVDVLVGLSAGTQAAAVAAAATPLVRRLVLVSPTFDPDRRSKGKMGLPHVRRLWAPLDVDEALRGLAGAGLDVRETGGPT